MNSKRPKAKKELMKSIFSSLIICSFFCLSHSKAEGNKVGNGGNGVYCKSGKIQTAQLLDFYEQKIDFKTTETEFMTIAEKQLTLLNQVAPKQGEAYLKRLKDIMSEVDFKNDITLTDVKDSNHLIKPLSENCHVYQTAIRRTKKMPEEKQFLVRKDLWDQLPALDKAGLITHEIIYEHLSKLGEENSVKAREMNRYIYRKNINKDDFWKFIKDLEILIYP